MLLAHVSEWKRDGDLNDPTDEHLNDSSQAACMDNRKEAHSCQMATRPVAQGMGGAPRPCHAPTWPCHGLPWLCHAPPWQCHACHAPPQPGLPGERPRTCMELPWAPQEQKPKGEVSYHRIDFCGELHPRSLARSG